MHLKCIIFDFDGTLADTEEHTFRIFNKLAEKHNYKIISSEDLHEIKHLNFMEILKRIGIPYAKLPKIMKEGQKLLKEDMEDIQPFQNDIKDVIDKIHEKVLIMGVITSNTKKNVVRFLLNYDIKAFDFIISSPLLSKEKKMNAIAKKYHLNKDEILYVGDEIRDIEACKKAKIKCAAVTWGYNVEETLKREEPDYIINKLEDLLHML
ncbi:MAG: HAD-IA family hydrolase [Eubacteriales bacterium]